MKRLSTTQKGSILGALLVIAVIVASILIFYKGCTTSTSDVKKTSEEYASFDEAPWDIEFTEDHVYNIDSEYIYFYVDTLFNETTQGIKMFKVRKDLTLQALDKKGPYYITKSCIVKFEKSTIIRKESIEILKGGG